MAQEIIYIYYTKGGPENTIFQSMPFDKARQIGADAMYQAAYNIPLAKASKQHQEIYLKRADVLIKALVGLNTEETK